MSIFGFISPSPVTKLTQPTVVPTGNVTTAGGWSLPMEVVGNPVQFLQGKQLAHGAKSPEFDFEQARLLGFNVVPQMEIGKPFIGSDEDQAKIMQANAVVTGTYVNDSSSSSDDDEDVEDEELQSATQMEIATEAAAEPVSEDDDDESEDEDENTLSIAENIVLQRAEARASEQTRRGARKNSSSIVIDARVSEVARRNCLDVVSRLSNVRRVTMLRPPPIALNALARKNDWNAQNIAAANFETSQIKLVFKESHLGDWSRRARETIERSSHTKGIWNDGVFDELHSRLLLTQIYHAIGAPQLPHARHSADSLTSGRFLDQVCSLMRQSRYAMNDSHIRLGLSGCRNSSAVFAPESLAIIPRGTIVGIVRGSLVTSSQVEFISGATDSHGNLLFPGYTERLVAYLRIPNVKFSTDGFITTFIDQDPVVAFAHSLGAIDAEHIAKSHIHGCIPFNARSNAGNVHHRLFSHNGVLTLTAVTSRPIIPGEYLTVQRSGLRSAVTYMGGMDVSSLERSVSWDDELNEFVVRPTPDRAVQQRSDWLYAF